MDKATIEAMRKIIDLNEHSIAYHEGYGDKEVYTRVGGLPLSEFRLANEGFRTLVDQAEAEQPKDATVDGGEALQYLRDLRDAATTATRLSGCKTPNVTVDTARFDAAVRAVEAMLAAKSAEAEQPQAPAEPDERDVLGTFVRAMEIAKTCAAKHGIRVVNISTADYLRQWSLFDVSAVVREIKGLMEPKPTTTGEPTIEYFDERVAAMNRAGFLGGSDWGVQVGSLVADTAIPLSVVIQVGDWLIDRERAEAAKGGA